jgi:hypothetical protein
VPAPPASSVTVTAGQRAQVKAAGERTSEVTLDTRASTGTPVRSQGPGGSLPGPAKLGTGHPVNQAGPHADAASARHTQPRTLRQGVQSPSGLARNPVDEDGRIARESIPEIARLRQGPRAPGWTITCHRGPRVAGRAGPSRRPACRGGWPDAPGSARDDGRRRLG